MNKKCGKEIFPHAASITEKERVKKPVLCISSYARANAPRYFPAATFTFRAACTFFAGFTFLAIVHDVYYVHNYAIDRRKSEIVESFFKPSAVPV